MISAAIYCLGVPRNGADDRSWRRGEGVFYHLTKTVGGDYFMFWFAVTLHLYNYCCAVSACRLVIDLQVVAVYSGALLLRPGFPYVPPPVVQIIDNRSSTINRKGYHVPKNPSHGVVFRFGPREKHWGCYPCKRYTSRGGRQNKGQSLACPVPNISGRRTCGESVNQRISSATLSFLCRK